VREKRTKLRSRLNLPSLTSVRSKSKLDFRPNVMKRSSDCAMNSKTEKIVFVKMRKKQSVSDWSKRMLKEEDSLHQLLKRKELPRWKRIALSVRPMSLNVREGYTKRKSLGRKHSTLRKRSVRSVSPRKMLDAGSWMTMIVLRGKSLTKRMLTVELAKIKRMPKDLSVYRMKKTVQRLASSKRRLIVKPNSILNWLLARRL